MLLSLLKIGSSESLLVLGGKVLLSGQTLGHGRCNIVVIDSRAVRGRSVRVHIKGVSIHGADRVASSLSIRHGH